MLPEDGGTYVVPRGDGWQNRPLHPGRVSGLINDYLHSLGIPDTAHSLRHSFGTEFYRASKDIRLTQELMGHASPITTAIYAAADMDSAAALVAAL
jgi:integrase/recombinase XerC